MISRRQSAFSAVFFLYFLASFRSLKFTKSKPKPNINGLTGKESNRFNASDPNSLEVFVSDNTIFIDSNPGHSIQAIREQIFGSNITTANPAPMNGFVQQAYSMGVSMPETVMSGFKPELLPIYTELVNEFAVFDWWFAFIPALTQSNQFYVHSATSHGASSNVRKEGRHPWLPPKNHVRFFGRK